MRPVPYSIAHCEQRSHTTWNGCKDASQRWQGQNHRDNSTSPSLLPRSLDYLFFIHMMFEFALKHSPLKICIQIKTSIEHACTEIEFKTYPLTVPQRGLPHTDVPAATTTTTSPHIIYRFRVIESDSAALNLPLDEHLESRGMEVEGLSEDLRPCAVKQQQVR